MQIVEASRQYTSPLAKQGSSDIIPKEDFVLDAVGDTVLYRNEEDFMRGYLLTNPLSVRRKFKELEAVFDRLIDDPSIHNRYRSIVIDLANDAPVLLLMDLFSSRKNLEDLLKPIERALKNFHGKVVFYAHSENPVSRAIIDKLVCTPIIPLTQTKSKFDGGKFGLYEICLPLRSRIVPDTSSFDLIDQTKPLLTREIESTMRAHFEGFESQGMHISVYNSLNSDPDKNTGFFSEQDQTIQMLANEFQSAWGVPPYNEYLRRKGVSTFDPKGVDKRGRNVSSYPEQQRGYVTRLVSGYELPNTAEDVDEDWEIMWSSQNVRSYFAEHTKKDPNYTITVIKDDDGKILAWFCCGSISKSFLLREGVRLSENFGDRALYLDTSGVSWELRLKTARGYDIHEEVKEKAKIVKEFLQTRLVTCQMSLFRLFDGYGVTRLHRADTKVIKVVERLGYKASNHTASSDSERVYYLHENGSKLYKIFGLIESTIIAIERRMLTWLDYELAREGIDLVYKKQLEDIKLRFTGEPNLRNLFYGILFNERDRSRNIKNLLSFINEFGSIFVQIGSKIVLEKMIKNLIFTLNLLEQ